MQQALCILMQVKTFESFFTTAGCSVHLQLNKRNVGLDCQKSLFDRFSHRRFEGSLMKLKQLEWNLNTV